MAIAGLFSSIRTRWRLRPIRPSASGSRHAAASTSISTTSRRTRSMAGLLRAAQRADATFAAPMELGVDGFQQLRDYLQEVREDLISQDEDFGEIRLACVVEVGTVLDDGLADIMLSRIVVSSAPSGF